MHPNTIVFVLLTANALTVDTGRILSVFGAPDRLIYGYVEPLLKELARRGHNVTSITNYAQKEPVENFRDIVIKENTKLFDEYKNFTLINIDNDHYDTHSGFFTKGVEMCENVFNNPEVIDLMKHEQFDLIIFDVFISESLYGLSQHFGAASVAISFIGPMNPTDNLVGNIIPMSYVPNLIMVRQSKQPMSFRIRCLNIILHMMECLHYYTEYMPLQRRLYEKYFPKARIPLDVVQKNFSLVLVNDHFTITAPRPYVPNMIEVAGMHIPKHTPPLSLYINEILNGAKHGVIYVATDSEMPAYLIDIFLAQFRNLPQIILWNSQYMPRIPKHVPANVHFDANHSRYSVMSHPNIRLIICSNLYIRIIESIHYGIPILGIPNFHHEDYVDFIKKIGNGLSLTWNQLNEKSFSIALHELLTIDRYARDAKELSRQFRDQQNSPLEKALYWVEYVLRHKGAPHMRNLGQNLSIWEFYNLDVLLYIGLIIILIICLANAIIKITIAMIMRYYNKTKIKTN